MSTVNNTIQERGAEWRAVAEAGMYLNLLNRSANELSGKRFARGRADRIERWQQLAECARKQAEGLETLAGVPRKRRPTITTPSVANPNFAKDDPKSVAAEASA